jgi:hypothetical protein
MWPDGQRPPLLRGHGGAAEFDDGQRSSLHQQLHLLHLLRDLHRVHRRALADLVAAAPEGQAVAAAGDVLPDAAHPHQVLVGGVHRHGIEIVGGIVHHLHPRRGRQQLPGLVRRDGPLGLNGDGLGVGAVHRHPHAGAVYQQLRQAQNLAALPEHLHLLVGVGVVLKIVDVRDQVEGDLVREGLRGDRLAVQHLPRLHPKLFETLRCPRPTPPDRWRR